MSTPLRLVAAESAFGPHRHGVHCSHVRPPEGRAQDACGGELRSTRRQRVVALKFGRSRRSLPVTPSGSFAFIRGTRAGRW